MISILKVGQSTSSSKSPLSKKFLNMMKPKKQFMSRGNNTKEALLKLREMRTEGTWVKCTDCLKWRYLPQVHDPAEIKDTWTCQDHPDEAFQHCDVRENLWNPAVNNNMVETRFTVGSIVMAKMDGWPAWPAMVDDDPDIGDFFWTELTGDHWTGTESPTQYHVVFFDTNQVSRAWIRDSNIHKFSGSGQTKPQPSSRLSKSLTEASMAANLSLSERRSKYCFSSRWSGGWGPVWPDYGEEVTDVDDAPFHDNDDEDLDQISQEILSQPDQERNMSFIDKSFNCDVLSSADNIVLPDLDQPGPSSAPVVCAKKSNAIEKKFKKSPATKLRPFGKKKTNKENIAPKLVSTTAHLYQNREIFTQEISEKIDNVAGHNMTFDEDSRDMLNSSLARDVDQALQEANLFTPIKRCQLALVSPAPASNLEMTTSTPVREAVLDIRGDVTKEDNVEADESMEDHNNNSNAFSHEGSFN